MLGKSSSRKSFFFVPFKQELPVIGQELTRFFLKKQELPVIGQELTRNYFLNSNYQQLNSNCQQFFRQQLSAIRQQLSAIF